MKTPITEMFDIEFPIVAFTHCRDVVAAVSKAGGLGVLGAVAHSARSLEIDLQWIEDEIGDRPYGVDLIVPAKYAGSDEGGLDMAQLAQLIPPQHREYLDEILARYDVPPMPEDDRENKRADDTGKAMFSMERAGPQLDVALAHKTALMVNALGPPPQHMIDRCKEQGVKVGALAGKAQHAERHVNAGTDVVIAQGYEAGGHTGEIGTMVLIPEIVDAVGKDVPILGAGGIGRGRQMAAAMALGAAGVWCGSVWLTTEEAETQPVVKEKFLAASSSDTVRSRSRTGKPARQLKSAWTEAWSDPDGPGPLGMPAQPALVDAALARIDRAAPNHEGAKDLANYFVGQIVGNMNKSKPAASVVFEMIEEFIEATESLAAQLTTD